MSDTQRQEHVLRLAEWSTTPGGRRRTDGPFSGQEFLEDVLLPAFQHAAKNGNQLQVDLDGAYGYSSGFLEEAFGGLSRVVGYQAAVETLLLKIDDEPYLHADISEYLYDAGWNRTRGTC